MQGINHAGQESSARSSRQARCRVCDGPVDWPNLVCRQCWQREREFEKWESYSEDPDGDDTTPANGPPAKDHVLIVLCGPSHAGKSTFAQALKSQGNFQVISSDEIRKQITGKISNFKHETEVWEAFQEAKRQALTKGHNVVLDACHISKEARRHSLEEIDSSYTKICLIFETPWQTIRDRCLGEKRIPLQRAREIWDRFQQCRPSDTELRILSFDEVFFLAD